MSSSTSKSNISLGLPFTQTQLDCFLNIYFFVACISVFLICVFVYFSFVYFSFVHLCICENLFSTGSFCVVANPIGLFPEDLMFSNWNSPEKFNGKRER